MASNRIRFEPHGLLTVPTNCGGQATGAIEQALRESESRFRKIFDASHDAIFVIDPARNAIVDVNWQACALLGYTPEELLAMPISAIHPAEMPRFLAFTHHAVDAGQGWTDELTCLTKSGSTLPSEISASAIELAGRSYLIAIVRDISERKRIEAALRQREQQLLAMAQRLQTLNAKLRRLSKLDSLTGLVNRRGLREGLEREWRRAARRGDPLNVVIADIDYFKRFNDRYGHQQGDACLKRVAGVVRRAARRQGDLAARYGGEEFLLVLPSTDAHGAAAVGDGLRAKVERLRIPHDDSLSSRFVTVSAGVATAFPGGSATLDQVIRAADRALYRAKQAGRNRVAVANCVVCPSRTMSTGPASEPCAVAGPVQSEGATR